MRNRNFQIDQFVFQFINSDKCNTLASLISFLELNQLPFRERWMFYCMGKVGYITEMEIQQMEVEGFDVYGGYIKGEIYHWHQYLNNSGIYQSFEDQFKEMKYYETFTDENDELNRIIEEQYLVDTKIYNIENWIKLNNVTIKSINDIDCEGENMEDVKPITTIQRLSKEEYLVLLDKLEHFKKISADFDAEITRLNNIKQEKLKAIQIDFNEFQKAYYEQGYRYVEDQIENDMEVETQHQLNSIKFLDYDYTNEDDIF